MFRIRSHAFVAALLTFATLTPLALVAQARATATPATAAPIPPSVYSTLHWRTIGPEGNRFTSAAGIPGDPLTYYVGAASGGVWKTTDGGTNWTPLFDDQPVQSIGSLAVAKSDPNVVWAGTGEGEHPLAHLPRAGRSTNPLDAGKTWTLMGLEKTGRIAAHRHPPTGP